MLAVKFRKIKEVRALDLEFLLAFIKMYNSNVNIL